MTILSCLHGLHLLPAKPGANERTVTSYDLLELSIHGDECQQQFFAFDAILRRIFSFAMAGDVGHRRLGNQAGASFPPLGGILIHQGK